MEGDIAVIAIATTGGAVSRALADQLRAAKSKVLWYSEEAAPDEFASAHSDLDTLFLILPTFPQAPMAEYKGSVWSSALQGTLTRAIKLITAVGAQMAAQKHGCIIVIGGLAGSTGFPGWGIASTVEGALIGLTRSLACEWAPVKVRVVFLCCGAVEGDSAFPVGSAMRTPLGRIGTPEEIAKVAVYLASDRASFITGTLVHADGGWSAFGMLK